MTTTLSAETTPTATRPVVALSGVGKSFGRGPSGVTALTGVDLRVEPGEFVCLLGASGCGKTTLLNLIAGLDKPSAGTIELRSGRPSVMFQEAALMPWLTAAGNVELALRLAGVRGRRAPRAHRGTAGTGAVGRSGPQTTARALRRDAAAGRAGPGAGRDRDSSTGRRRWC